MSEDELMDFARHLGQQADDEEWQTVLAAFDALNREGRMRMLLDVSQQLVGRLERDVARLEAEIERLRE